MSRMHRNDPQFLQLASELDLPRGVVRHLVLAHGLAIGTEVLDAGCGDGRLVAYLRHLGIDAAGLDECPDNVADALQLQTGSNIEHCPHGRPLPFERQQFHAVIVRQMNAFGGNLFSAAALERTAGLLGCIRPGGCLVMVARNGRVAEGNTVRHSAECFKRHLKCFSQAVSTRQFAGGLLTPILRATTHTKSEGVDVVSCRLPAVSIAAEQWRAQARASISVARACCAEAAELLGDHSPRKAAA